MLNLVILPQWMPTSAVMGTASHFLGVKSPQNPLERVERGLASTPIGTLIYALYEPFAWLSILTLQFSMFV